MSQEDRRSQPLFSIGIVKDLTGLTARQIRYYEEHQLIHPARTEGNQRLFSFNDVDRLLEIKELIEKGINLAGIKQVLQLKDLPVTEVKDDVVKEDDELSDKELRKYLRQELLHTGRYGKASLRQGELSQFFRQ
ncbi:HTH-type transcriptional regulator GlnR [Halolactibacillus alkaliphilus]|uniref:HTH-type transcriptional regulator GlnR n=1 Tax=Halolactibacillus alkaliphilus TaxID=442899 RepID=A0A511X4K1_9BACI|nr:MerR family transcriptional regulator [Halolactibacillus alkaliphilus]GEN57880.1 HTH-type transcriptional regulator GlnR [Halolactibacillus alkaliphilus]GGN73524.1 HTH-type transcriptional regulator GlnR [Halolactibacillus alkaliphilus]SFO97080.1 MerR family transcriptional regulator, glutamine synthetase repressor [Halolactibacillus alkaliphilus]